MCQHVASSGKRSYFGCEEALLQVLYLVYYQKKKKKDALKEIELKINGDKNPLNQSI